MTSPNLRAALDEATGVTRRINATLDARALHDIAILLDGTEWNADTCQDIADIVRCAGFTIRDADEHPLDCTCDGCQLDATMTAPQGPCADCERSYGPGAPCRCHQDPCWDCGTVHTEHDGCPPQASILAEAKDVTPRR